MAQEELTQQQLTEEQKAKAINLGGLMAHLDEFRQEHVDNKVDKETGKGLSHNDLTDSLLQKLNGLQNYDDTTVRALIAAVASDLQTYYYQKTDTYSQTEIDQRLSAIPKFGIEIVQTLPLTVEDQVQANFDEDDIETPQSDKVYMVPDTNAQSPNMYTEYLYIEDDDDFEMLGTQRLDLSGYSTTQQMNAAIAAAIANMPTMSATAVTAANAGNKTFFVGEQGNDGKWILQPMSQTELAKIAYNYMKTSAIAAEYASVLGEVLPFKNALDVPIVFESDKVKEILVNAFGGTTGGSTGIPGFRGEITYRQAAGVTVMSNLFGNKQLGGVSFNEAKYFVRLNNFTDSNFRYSGISSIVFPQSFTYLGANLLTYTSQMSLFMEFPENFNRIGSWNINESSPGITFKFHSQNPPTRDANAMISKVGKVLVPAAYEANWRADSYWNSYGAALETY